MNSNQLSIVIVGHVDHGKSTLIGRLLHDTDSLPDGKFEEVQAVAKRRGMPFEWSFLLDALQSERDQGVTIDTTQIWFNGPTRRYCIIDAPGHKSFLKNMISGAAQAQAALLIIDAEEGVQEQTRRHGYLLHLLGIRQIAVLVNKMDRVGYDQARFDTVVSKFRDYLGGLGVHPQCFIPVSAREGDGIIQSSEQLPWYRGPSLLDALEHFTAQPETLEQPLRFPLQDVYKFDERRILAGRIESGQIRVGDELRFLPSNQRSTVKSIEAWPQPEHPIISARAGQSIGITITDPLYIERGEIACDIERPAKLVNQFRARLIWLADTPLEAGKRYRLKLLTGEYPVVLRSIDQVVDTEDLSHSSGNRVEKHGIGEVTLRLQGMAALDAYEDLPKTGRFILLDGYEVAGGGIVLAEKLVDQRVAVATHKATNVTKVPQQVTPEERILMNGHRGGIVWLTGLSGSGKSTLAQALQRRLFARGCQTYVLDGDNLRHGLCADLGFTHEDRSENVRRAGEVAALFAKAGMIVISAFISPYAEDRRRARAAAPEFFHTVHVKADLSVCEARDVKGLYAKARAGEIEHFTGIDSPYEEPTGADLVLDTASLCIEEATDQLEAYVNRWMIEQAEVSKSTASSG